MATPAAILNIALIANTKAANTALAGTQARLRATAATSTATSATMKKAFLGIGLAAGAAGAALFKIGEEFDQVSDTIRTKTGASGKELKKLEGSFKTVVKSVPTDFDSAATAIAGLNQRLGLTGRPLEKLTKQVTQLALVTGTDVQENVEAVTRLFGDWEVATKNQTETLDGLFRLSQQTGTSVSELSRNLVQFGAPLRNLGIDMDFAAAMFANFEKTGVNMTTVLSGLRLGVGNLNQPTDDLKAALDKLNISIKNPQKALVEIFDSIRTLDQSAATALGIQAFGKRAGPDLVDTVRGGKFELDKLTQSFRTGDETISKAERSTRDFSEQWTLFINRAKTFLEPVATKFFEAIGNGMKALNRLDLDKAIESLRKFWQSAGLLRDTFAKVSAAVKENLKGLGQFVSGITKTISGLLTGNFGRAWDGVKDIFSSGVKNMVSIVKGITAPMRAALQAIANEIKDIFNDAWRSAKNVVDSAVDDIMDNVHLLAHGLDKGFGAIAKFTNQALDTFGAKDKVKYDVGSISPFQKGGVVYAASGTLVPGSGTGDKVPAMLEPGEVVLNRKAVAAMGGANKANAINSMVPRFAVGGEVGGLHPGILGLVNSLAPFGAFVSSGLRAADSGSLHSTGQAADVTFSDWSGASRAVNAVGSKLLEGIYNPGTFGGQAVSWDTGQSVASSFWGSEWGNHLDHIHLAVADGAAAIAGGIAKQIKRVMLNGPDGPLKNMGQGALDMVRGAANALLSKQTGITGDTSATSSGAYKGNLDRVFPHPTTVANPGIALAASQVAGLASKAGLNGDTFEKISRGESGHHPGIVGYDPGGTRGLGLWQITTGYNSDIIERFGGETQMFNPWVNAQAAKAIYDRQGIGAWYGTQYLAKGGKVGGGMLTGSPLFGVHLQPSYGGGIGKPGGKPPTYTPNPMGPSTRSPAELPASIQDHLNKVGYVIGILDEQISNAETLAGFSTSEMGTALGPGEKAEQIALNKDLLRSLIEGAAWIKQGLNTPHLNIDTVSTLSGALLDIQGITGQGGKILTVRQKLDQLGASDTSTGPDLAAINALLGQQLLEANQRFNVSQAQYGVFAGMRAGGGAIGAGQWGIAGEAGPEVVAGPARVYSNGDSSSMLSPSVEVIIKDGAMAWLDQHIEVKVDGVTRRQARGRPMPGVRG